jgi:membrane protein
MAGDASASAVESDSDPPLRTDARAVWKLVRQAGDAWVEDRAATMGAALAYYTVFSVAPLLLIVISIAGLVFGAEAARGEIFAELRDLMGTEAALALQGLLRSVKKPEESLLATAIGLAVLLVGATTVFGELQDTLDHIWRAPARGAESSGLWGLVRSRFLSFGMILGIGFLLIVSLLLSSVLAALGKWWDPVFMGWTLLAGIVNFVLSFVLTTAVFAMIYKIMPRVQIHWRDVWVGAGVTSLLFTLGKSLIGLYIGKSSIASGFGAAGSLVVVLVWVYYSAQIFLLGAEFTWAYAHTYGSRRGIDRNAPVAPVNPAAPALSAEKTGAGLPARAAATVVALAAVALAEKTRPTGRPD